MALLITAVALAVSLAVAFTVVSIGIARADTCRMWPTAAAAACGGHVRRLVIAGIGGLTAAMVRTDVAVPARLSAARDEAAGVLRIRRIG